jgi:hypothetical protein
MSPSSPLVVKMVGMERRQLSWQRGGREPTIEEAELVVTMVAGVSTYLSKKHRA